MNKADLILLLKQYKENKAKLKIKLKELNSKRIELKAIDDIEITLSSTNYETNSDIHSKNKINDFVGNKVSENEDKRRELKTEIKELEAETKELREKVETIDDRLEILTFKEKTLLTSYYIEECSYSEIGNRVYRNIYNETRSEDTIKRMIERALKKVAKL